MTGTNHPLTVYVRQDRILPALDAWLARVFAPGRLRQTLREMRDAQQLQPQPTTDTRTAQRTVADCERRLERYRNALEAGADSKTVTRWISTVLAQQTAARAEIAAAEDRRPAVLGEADIERMITALGGMTDAIQSAPSGAKGPLYDAFGLRLTYKPQTRTVIVESQPALKIVDIECPRGDLNPHAR
ncbi:hypothetical protein AB0M28_28060 [Streptomyces sp. NPDC051940]|uniref:hypothetical protein n=1 Tax=Streptomyces sp. NPDC051940 TaxID=3155675 RepID=UPI00342A4CFF